MLHCRLLYDRLYDINITTELISFSSCKGNDFTEKYIIKFKEKNIFMLIFFNFIKFCIIYLRVIVTVNGSMIVFFITRFRDCIVLNIL